MKLKRLFFDIETSPNLVYSWRAGFKINISHESIVQERKIITVAWKWQGEKKVYAATWDNNQNDKALLETFLPVAEQAHEIVAHYGDGFDIPWIRGRALFHGLQLPIYNSVDTKAWSSRYFYLNSNKLDYLAKYLGIGGKIETSYDLWLDVMRGDNKALARMVRYNKFDVVLLEKVWAKLAKLSPVRTHAGALNGERWSCPLCGSENVVKNLKRVTATGMERQLMNCRACHKYYTVSGKVRRDYDEAKSGKPMTPR